MSPMSEMMKTWTNKSKIQGLALHVIITYKLYNLRLRDNNLIVFHQIELSASAKLTFFASYATKIECGQRKVIITNLSFAFSDMMQNLKALWRTNVTRPVILFLKCNAAKWFKKWLE